MSAVRKKKVEPVPVPVHVQALADKANALLERYYEVSRREFPDPPRGQVPRPGTPFSRKYPFLSWGDTKEKVRAQVAWLAYLRARRDGVRAAIAVGLARVPDIYLQGDPTWLVDMAIDRRAGWPDDPDRFGAVMPVKRWWPGRMVVPIFQYPKSATQKCEIHPQTIHMINTPRVVVRALNNGIPRRYREKLRKRLTWPEDEER